MSSLLDHPTISERYFFPRRAPIEGPLVVRTGDGVELHCKLTLAGADAPLLIHFHGNGEVVADWMGEWPEAFASLGISTLLAEYRGYGGSSGEPKLAAMLEDTSAIFEAADADPSRTVVYGRSVGSIYALHLAAAKSVAGLVIESGIADVRERLLLRMRPGELGTTPEALDAEIAAHLDHEAKVESFAGEILVLHAAGDDLVPPTHGKQLAAWGGDRSTLKLFERGDHNTIHAYNGAEIVALTAELVRRVTTGA